MNEEFPAKFRPLISAIKAEVPNAVFEMLDWDCTLAVANLELGKASSFTPEDNSWDAEKVAGEIIRNLITPKSAA